MNSQERLNRYESKYGMHKTALLNKPVLKDVLSKGYAVIPGFWSSKQCQRGVAKFDQLLLSNDHKVWRDELGADKRIFGADKIAAELDLYSDPTVTRWIQQLYDSEELSGFSMAGRIDAFSDNLGSGQGWHRDSCVTYQFKAILYLSDVATENGPFQYRPNSASIDDILYLEKTAGIELDSNRLDDFSDVIEQSMVDELIGKQGTLVLADTRGIHRGKPIQRGTRYALTNYYWQGDIPKHIVPFVNK